MSEEILKLVRTVAGLPREDQNRVLRLVDLLSQAPYSVQRRSQVLLRELLSANPRTKLECVAGIDELIDYLERAEPTPEGRNSVLSEFFLSSLRGTTQ